jgi:hypothetical protein
MQGMLIHREICYNQPIIADKKILKPKNGCFFHQGTFFLSIKASIVLSRNHLTTHLNNDVRKLSNRDRK